MKHSWTLLKRLERLSILPWVCMGDFNEIMGDEEKFGGLQKNWKAITDFREIIKECSLEDMGFVGPCFTWSNKREGSGQVMKRLDRGLCSRDWRRLFPQFVVKHLEFWGSDHRPLVLDVTEKSVGRKKGRS